MADSNNEQRRLQPDEVEFARRRFGDLPYRELATALFDLYDQSEIEQFGSHEAAEAHRAMVAQLEQEMITAQAASERRLRGLSYVILRFDPPTR